MTAYAVMQLMLGFAVIFMGIFLIRRLGLSLPKSRTLIERIKRMFWIYSSDIPRNTIARHHAASVVVLLAAFVIVLIFRAIWRG